MKKKIHFLKWLPTNFLRNKKIMLFFKELIFTYSFEKKNNSTKLNN